jgi:hypothetical protein
MYLHELQYFAFHLFEISRYDLLVDNAYVQITGVRGENNQTEWNFVVGGNVTLLDFNLVAYIEFGQAKSNGSRTAIVYILIYVFFYFLFILHLNIFLNVARPFNFTRTSK